jgi:ribosome biogenesis GTPase
LKKIYDIKRFGWNDFFEAYFSEINDKELIPARVFLEHRKYYKLYSEYGELKAEKTGKIFFNSIDCDLIPAVGDWLAVKIIPQEKKAFIHYILPRKSKLSRKKAGFTTEEQIIASNIDIVFIMNSLAEEINFKRIDRFLTIAIDNNIKPVILLNKLDLCNNYNDIKNKVENRFPLYETFAICSIKSIGIEKLYKFFDGNKTAAIIGKSGVGKSTLINKLLHQDILKVNEVSSFTKKGKHTTTKRELFLMPYQGLIIDTPGMREIQLWEGLEGINELFSDIEELSLNCKFRNCKHETEPDCAVINAINKGTLEADRFISYKKLFNEISYLENKQFNKDKIVKKKNKKLKNYKNDNNIEISDEL